MTQAEMERELSNVTGESVGEIRRRGFSLIVMPDRGPLTVDWDAVQQLEPMRFLPRRRRKRCAA
jgi:hypothetical protein